MIKLMKFLIVGGTAFVADYIFFNTLLAGGLGLTISRVIAFWFALQITWLGNSFFTFRQNNTTNSLRRWVKHCVTGHFTGCINIGAFLVAVDLNANHDIAFIGGILIGTAVNFFCADRWVFTQTKA